ncbi:MAG: class I SAM-dependent methyltransferase [Candidatus Eremiobacteraeota bacterium]|nr:class I SAM-dependent methyltransferase [Candidatus Eremiobacteraeota bacterium]MBC5801757.1 class I SAM-dependent methyltransferase [Candidatus Eremiobacteraeota bacterium]MBC5820851.1 class I SAM-dependent methyltransferase [Candidatus Eremiobacteraeota bacterium]
MRKNPASSAKLHLLPLADLRKTGPVDEADWNYRPLLSFVSRRRFRLVLDLLGPAPPGDLLEIGYGSGVFALELARRSKRLWGIDIHPFPAEVMQTLKRHGVAARLTTGSIEKTDYPDRAFDCAVAVSALEFVADLDAACRELCRILKPGANLVIAAPQSSPILDALLFAATRERAGENYEGRRERLLPALERYFVIERSTMFPKWAPLAIYRAFRLRPRFE